MEGDEEVHTMSKNFLILPQMDEYKEAHQRFLSRLTLMRLEVRVCQEKDTTSLTSISSDCSCRRCRSWRTSCRMWCSKA